MTPSEHPPAVSRPPRDVTVPAFAVPEWAFAVAGGLVGAWMAAGTAVFSAFLTALRVGGTLVPVAWLVVALGTAAAVTVTRLTTPSRLALLAPVAAWLLVLLPLTGRRPEGDVVVPGTWVGYGTVLIGMVVLAVAVFASAIRPPRPTRSGHDAGTSGDTG